LRLLHKLGHEATQSSVSRDLRELGVIKAGDRYVLLPEIQDQVNGVAGRAVRDSFRTTLTVKDCSSAVERRVRGSCALAQWSAISAATP
jgi:arginine repressor